MVYDNERKKLYIKGREIEFRRKGTKAEIVEYLIENRGKWSTVEEIGEAIYGVAVEGDSGIRRHILGIRKILGEEMDIKNRKGIGYRIEVRSE